MAKQPKPDPLARIECNPEIMVGKPVIRGTRITVELILDKIAADVPLEEILVDFPHLTRADVLAAVAYARTIVASDRRA